MLLQLMAARCRYQACKKQTCLVTSACLSAGTKQSGHEQNDPYLIFVVPPAETVSSIMDSLTVPSGISLKSRHGRLLQCVRYSTSNCTVWYNPQL